MAIIEVEGLGKVEIEGEVPNAEETKSIQKALELNTADVEPGLETDTIIPELIDPNLTNLGKAEDAAHSSGDVGVRELLLVA